VTLTPFRSESARAQRRAGGSRGAQPDVTGYVDAGDAAHVTGYGDAADDTAALAEPGAGLAEDELVLSDPDLELWDLEDRYAEPAADPTPTWLPRPLLRPGETTQRRAPRRAHGRVPGRPSPPPRPDARRGTAGRPATHGRRPGRRKPPPVMRLGVLWALVLGIAIGFVPPVAALLLVPITAIAAHTAWRRMDPPVTEPAWLPAVAAGACPIIAIAGPLPALAAVLLAAGAVGTMTGRGAPRHEQVKLGICVGAPAAASASLIAACALSPTIGLALFTAVCLFDAANYIMGVGETGGALGAVAGMAILAVLALLLAGLFVVPFGGSSPWVLCGVVAVGATVSTGAAHTFVGRTRLPAWRRLDSLFIAGPLWVLLSALLVVH
jgi:hypothetical protein